MHKKVIPRKQEKRQCQYYVASYVNEKLAQKIDNFRMDNDFKISDILRMALNEFFKNMEDLTPDATECCNK